MFLDSIKTSQPAKGKVRRTTGPFYVERHNAMMERGGRLVEVPSLPVEEGRRGTGGGVEFGRHEAAQAGRQAGEIIATDNCPKDFRATIEEGACEKTTKRAWNASTAFWRCCGRSPCVG